MRRLLPPLAALVSALWMSTAVALGLGEIDVRSRLNQRFVAAIPLIAVSAEQARGLTVGLAEAGAFDRAGIERLPYLSTLRFEVRTDGTPRIQISSDQLAREPFLMLLLEVRDAGTRLLREYTVFLDPPDYDVPQPVGTPQGEFYETAAEAAEGAAATPAPVPVRPAAVATPAPAVAAEIPAAARREPMAEDRYGPVEAQETLWGIATRLRPDGAVTMDQMLLALFTANPRAFDGGINGLLRGAVLRVPSLEEVQSVTPAAAREEVARLRGLPAASGRVPQQPAVRTIAAPASAPTPEATASPAPRTVPVSPAPIVLPASAPVAPVATVTDGLAVTAAPAEPAADSTIGDVAAGSVPEGEAVDAAAAPTPAPVAAVEARDEEEIVVSGLAPAPREAGLLETLLLPLVGGLLVLGGLGYLVSRLLARRKRGGTDAGAQKPRTPAVTPKPAPAAPAAGAAAGAARAATETFQEALDKAAQHKPEATVQLQTREVPAQAVPKPAMDATQMLDAAAAATETVDFDLTGQFESQTVQINLDANDPVSEADFHLAYGLYDEAALLLKQAAEKDPARTDIRVKLAETYFAAGKPAEFQQCAEEIRPLLSVTDWQKVAIMGQQLCPDAEVFQGRQEPGAVATSDLDLDLGGAEAEMPLAAVQPEQLGRNDLDFRLDDLDLPKVEEPQLEIAATGKGEALEFDLSQFDLTGAIEEAPAQPAATEARAKVDNAVEFDLDLDTFDQPAPAAKPAAAAPAQGAAGLDASTQTVEVPAPASEVPELRLDDVDLGDVSLPETAPANDEVATKLDLARAYTDMGDNEMARALLDEVVQQGDAQQQQEARSLMERLV